MSWEAWGDPPDSDGVTDERCAEIAAACFIRGAQACREMMARFVEQQGCDVAVSESIRANWNSEWSDDPGKPTNEEYAALLDAVDPWHWAD